MKGLLLVVSGPSGAGKSTVLNTLMEKREDVFFSVSVTTRPPRPEEKEGRDYFFVSSDEFCAMQLEGRLLEVGTFAGNWYGTLEEEILARRARGEILILDIESTGAAQVKEKMPDSVFIFLTPVTEEEAERRLRERGTENEEIIQKRMAASRLEYAQIDKYQYIVVNDNVEDAVSAIEAIICAESHRTERNKELFQKFR